MKQYFVPALALLAVVSLSNCRTTTYVVETKPVPVVVKPKPTPTPAQFKVVNQYDYDQR